MWSQEKDGALGVVVGRVGVWGDGFACFVSFSRYSMRDPARVHLNNILAIKQSPLWHPLRS